MTQISNYIIPCIVIIMIVHGLFKGVNVFSEFTDGAKDGFKIVLNILPSLVALIFSIELLKVSGALETVCSLLSPVSSFLGIPEEVTPLTILSPISGSGSLGMFESILKDHGPDSFIGRCASVMMGSTETTFYTMTVYYGSVGVKKTRHTLPSALCADFASFIFSPKIVKLFFYQ
ncbi:MAG: spore maturation protein [Clostridia bacterium]|nr:spore maturation protein [Clostridia bacterium]